MRALLVDARGGGAEEIIIALHLGWEGSEVTRTTTGGGALKELGRLDPEIVVIYGAVPDIEGPLLIEQIRRFSDAVIIAISLEYNEGELIDLTEAGADDYMVPPINRTRFIARVRSALRRVRPKVDQESEIVTWHDLMIDLGRHEATLGDRPLLLTATEFKLMFEIVKRGDVVSHKSSLFEAVWGESSDDLSGDLLRKYVHQLRRKLQEVDGSLTSIVTIPSVGYKLAEQPRIFKAS